MPEAGGSTGVCAREEVLIGRQRVEVVAFVEACVMTGVDGWVRALDQVMACPRFIMCCYSIMAVNMLSTLDGMKS